eukprot:7245643-Pyramimonas_sp.AAC.1
MQIPSAEKLTTDGRLNVRLPLSRDEPPPAPLRHRLYLFSAPDLRATSVAIHSAPWGRAAHWALASST